MDDAGESAGWWRSGLPLIVLAAARIAIVASAENADGQPNLRYAQRDGQRMADTLTELVDFAQITRLRQPSLRQLEQALDEAERRAAQDPALEIFIYYSGHADENGLLLGAERLTYSALRGRLERSRAAVRVAFLDACHTGSLVRAKGGVPTWRSVFQGVTIGVEGRSVVNNWRVGARLIW